MPSIWQENKKKDLFLNVKKTHMWLCHMWFGICSNQHTVLITHHVKFSFSDDSKMPEPKSVIKMIWYNHLPEVSCMTSQT